MSPLPEPPTPPPLPPLQDIPDENEIDTPAPGKPLGRLGPLGLPEIVFGAGPFSAQYNDDAHIASLAPLRTIRLALRYGIRAFDTSPYYGPSEIVLGNALEAVEKEFPRSSYQLMTKCGRYGVDHFDYSPATIRTSVQRSLRRMKTSYLDTVYLHDCEFVCTPVAPRKTGNHVFALAEDRAAYGLAEGQEGKVWGEGDQRILDAVAELRKMQDEGLVKNVGITGYPLPTLLRLALLVLHTAPYRPLDVVLSYSHLNLQNQTFTAFAPHFAERAKVRQLLTASPLSMGLLTPHPPAWHPAPKELRAAVDESLDAAHGWAGGLPNLAQGFAIRHSGPAHGDVPLVAGFSLPQEVHECVKIWRELQDTVADDARKGREDDVQKIFERSGFLNWSWASP